MRAKLNPHSFTVIEEIEGSIVQSIYPLAFLSTYYTEDLNGHRTLYLRVDGRTVCGTSNDSDSPYFKNELFDTSDANEIHEILQEQIGR